MQSEADANDTSINKEDEGTSVTMVDVLKEQEAFEEDAKAVLGASDDKNCTYNSGYVKRQALYACITCCPDSVSDPSTRAGMCLACSLVCHENHDLVELYTKRNFRCDCGSPKFPKNPCNFTGNKSEPNIQNSYNQNFAGLYCICHRPYPDPESNDDDEMIQCIICEDWLHSKHLNSKVPLSDQYSEMICQACMSSNDFLNNYMCYNVKAEERENESNMSVEMNDLDKSLAENNTHIDDMDQTDDCSLNTMDTSTCLNADESITPIEQDKHETKSAESPLNDPPSKSDVNDIVMATTEECNESDKIAVNTASDASSHMNSVEKSSESAIVEDKESNDKNMQPTEINSLLTETSVEEIESKPVEMVLSDEIKIDTPLESVIPPSDNPDMLAITPQDDKIDTVNVIEGEISSVENTNDPIEKIVNEDVKEITDIGPEDSKVECGDSSNIDKLVTENVVPIVTAESIENSTDESNKKSEMLPEIIQPTEILHQSMEPIEPSTEIHSDETNAIPSVADNKIDEPPVINENVTPDNSTVKISSNMDTDEGVNLIENSTDMEKNISPVIEMHGSNLTLVENIEPIVSDDNDLPGTLSSEVTGSLPLTENDCIKEDISPIIVSEGESDPSSESKEVAFEGDSNCTLDKASPEAEDVEIGLTGGNSTNLEIESSDPVNENVKDNSETTKMNVLENNTEKTQQTLSNGEVNGEEDHTNSSDSKKRKLDDETISDGEVVKKKKMDTAEVVCIRPSEDRRVQHHGAVFWPSDWRRKLCPCSRCMATYDEKKVSFLLDTEDTVTAYEDLGKIKNSGSSQYEKGLEALSSLGHVQQINAITEYNKMKEKLNEFLTTFKNTNKVVKEEDIKSFFAGMKPKREPDGVYFCH